MSAVKLGCGQIEKSILVLIDQPAAFLGRGPILAGNFERRAQSRSLSLNDCERLARLARDHRRHAGLEDASLFSRYLNQGVAEKFAMIKREPGNHARQRTFDPVGGVEPPTEANLEQGDVGRMAREQQKCYGGLHFKDCNRRTAISRFAFRQRIAELGVANEPPTAVPAEAK